MFYNEFMDNEIDKAKGLLDDICEENRFRDKDIMLGIDGEKIHALDVLKWAEKISQETSLALRLAALFHDIDRVVTPNEGGSFRGSRRSEAYKEYKMNHAKRSADYIIPRLSKIGINEEVLERARFLIIHHDDNSGEAEKLNDSELDHLVAADVFAFFTSVWPKLLTVEGMERSRDKLKFMIGKISDSLRKQLSELKLENGIADETKNELIKEYYNSY